uniref:Uncharacterized protein n=1 Tax=Panagrolaimus superbus TaxID=310955 RepID=A0A914YTD3_9BILA
MYFITERYFKSRFIKKDDQQQKADSPPQMRTAESPSTANPEEIQKITRESQEKATTKSSSSIQDSSDTASYNNASKNDKPSMDVSGKKNLQT